MENRVGNLAVLKGKMPVILSRIHLIRIEKSSHRQADGQADEDYGHELLANIAILARNGLIVGSLVSMFRGENAEGQLQN